MEIFWNILLLILGFAILIKGADWLVDGASNLARHYRISELVIGLTIVAFGTSAPELIVNIFASINGHNGVAYGNVIGSNLFNLLFILGIAGLIYPLSVQKQTVRKEIPLSMLAAVIILVLVNDQITFSQQNLLSRLDAVVLLIFFCGFMIYIFRSMKPETDTKESEKKPVGKSALFIGIGLVGLIFGGKLVVDNAINLAEIIGMSQKLIGLTIVAAGTSLPELATSAVAARKRNSDIAVGNVIGSNIFNIFFILGLSGLIKPIPYDQVLNTDIILLIAGTFLLLGFMYTSKTRKVDRWEALVLLLSYLGYVFYLILRE